MNDLKMLALKFELDAQIARNQSMETSRSELEILCLKEKCITLMNVASDIWKVINEKQLILNN